MRGGRFGRLWQTKCRLPNPVWAPSRVMGFRNPREMGFTGCPPPFPMFVPFLLCGESSWRSSNLRFSQDPATFKDSWGFLRILQSVGRFIVRFDGVSVALEHEILILTRIYFKFFQHRFSHLKRQLPEQWSLAYDWKWYADRSIHSSVKYQHIISLIN